MTTITAAGYIVTNNEGITFGLGYGPTADAAWADTEQTLKDAMITLLDDDDDSEEQSGSWTRRSGFTTRPATAALIESISTRGGDVAWRSVRGVACTVDEEADEDDAS